MYGYLITNLNMQSSIWVLYLAYCGMSLAEIGILEGVYHATSIFGWFALSFMMQALGNNFNSGSEEALVYDSMKCLGREEHCMGVYGKLNVVIEISQGIATVPGGILAEYSYFSCYSVCLAIGVLALLPVSFMTEIPCGSSGKETGGVRELVVRHFKNSIILSWVIIKSKSV